jgi:hypothetical protein
LNGWPITCGWPGNGGPSIAIGYSLGSFTNDVAGQNALLTSNAGAGGASTGNAGSAGTKADMLQF